MNEFGSEDRIAKMERTGDWDGEGAKPITKTTCGEALDFSREIDATLLPRPNAICPGTDGSIGFSWLNHKSLLHIKVEGNSWFLARRTDKSGSAATSLSGALLEVEAFFDGGQ